jgi:transcriptional regulator with XRE-family HTH domain
MPKTLSDVVKILPRERRARIEAETAREIEKIMTLGEIRRAFQKSQKAVAEELGMEQESISRIERRTDLLLSTMRKYIAAMGGNLKLVAEFPGRPPVQIETLVELEEERAPRKPARRKRA